MTVSINSKFSPVIRDISAAREVSFIWTKIKLKWKKKYFVRCRYKMSPYH